MAKKKKKKKYQQPNPTPEIQHNTETDYRLNVLDWYFIIWFHSFHRIQWYNNTHFFDKYMVDPQKCRDKVLLKRSSAELAVRRWNPPQPWFHVWTSPENSILGAIFGDIIAIVICTILKFTTWSHQIEMVSLVVPVFVWVLYISIPKQIYFTEKKVRQLNNILFDQHPQGSLRFIYGVIWILSLFLLFFILFTPAIIFALWK